MTILTQHGLVVLVLQRAPWRLAWQRDQAVQLAMEIVRQRAWAIQRGSRILSCGSRTDPSIRFWLTTDQAGYLASELYQQALALKQCPAGAVTVRISE